MSQRIGIILVKKEYIEKFKNEYIKHKLDNNYGLVSLCYFGNKELKENTILTSFEIRNDDKSKKISSIINESPKLFDNAIFDSAGSPYIDRWDNLTILKEKTIVNYLSNAEKELRPYIDKDHIFKEAYTETVNTLNDILLNKDCYIFIGVR